MTDITISGLPLLEDPSGPLEAEILDPADTTASSSGTNKRAVLAGPYLIETLTNASAGEFDFSDIPSGFSHLLLRGSVRSDYSGESIALRWFINSDTTDTNYNHQQMNADDASAVLTEGNTAFCASSTASNSPANSTCSMEIFVPFYEGTQLKTAQCEFASYYATGKYRAGDTDIWSSITAAITRIRVRTNDHPTSGIVGTMSLYGLF